MIDSVPGLGKVEQAIFDVLSDGRPHYRHELTNCLWDEMGVSPEKTIVVHIVSIRKKIAPFGLCIASSGRNSSMVYRLVRHITPDPI